MIQNLLQLLLAFVLIIVNQVEKVMQKTSMNKCETKTKQFAKLCPLHWSLIRGQHITAKRKVNGGNVGNLEKEKRALSDRQ